MADDLFVPSTDPITQGSLQSNATSMGEFIIEDSGKHNGPKPLPPDLFEKTPVGKTGGKPNDPEDPDVDEDAEWSGPDVPNWVLWVMFISLLLVETLLVAAIVVNNAAQPDWDNSCANGSTGG